MLAYISLSHGGPAAGVPWGDPRHHNGTYARKVVPYHPGRAQKRRGARGASLVWAPPCSQGLGSFEGRKD